MHKKYKLIWKDDFGDRLVILGAQIAIGAMILFLMHILWQRFL